MALTLPRAVKRWGLGCGVSQLPRVLVGFRSSSPGGAAPPSPTDRQPLGGSRHGSNAAGKAVPGTWQRSCSSSPKY